MLRFLIKFRRYCFSVNPWSRIQRSFLKQRCSSGITLHYRPTNYKNSCCTTSFSMTLGLEVGDEAIASCVILVHSRLLRCWPYNVTLMILRQLTHRPSSFHLYYFGFKQLQRFSISHCWDAIAPHILAVCTYAYIQYYIYSTYWLC